MTPLQILISIFNWCVILNWVTIFLSFIHNLACFCFSRSAESCCKCQWHYCSSSGRQGLLFVTSNFGNIVAAALVGKGLLFVISNFDNIVAAALVGKVCYLLFCIVVMTTSFIKSRYWKLKRKFVETCAYLVLVLCSCLSIYFDTSRDDTALYCLSARVDQVSVAILSARVD